MSRRLTEDEIREPDVELRISWHRWQTLPESMQWQLDLCATSARATSAGIVLILPAYRLREFEQEMKRLS